MSGRSAVRTSTAAAYALTLLLVVGCYAAALDGPSYLRDDDVLVFGGWSVWDDPAGLVRIWGGERSPSERHYRPVVDSARWLVHRVWGDDPLGYRVLNLLLHLATVLIAVRTYRRMGLAGAAWMAPFVALHPLAVQSVMWPSQGGATLLACLLFVAATWAFVRQHQDGRWRFGLLGLGFLVLAILAKSHAAMFPVVLVLIGLAAGARPARRTTILVAASVVVAVVTGRIGTSVEAISSYSLPLDVRARQTAVSVLQYLRNELVPFPLGYFYDFEVSALEWICAAGLLGAVALCWHERGRAHALRLVALIGAFLAIVAPAMTGNVTWFDTPAQDRYQYLGAFLVVPYLGHVLAPQLARGGRVRARWIVGLALAGALLVAGTVNQLIAYSSPDRLFRLTARIATMTSPLREVWCYGLLMVGDVAGVQRVVGRGAATNRNKPTLALSLIRAQIATGQLGPALALLPPTGTTFMTDGMRASILLDAPDAALRDDAAGAAAVASMERWLVTPWAPPQARAARVPEVRERARLDAQIMRAAVHAAEGRFPEAAAVIDEVMRHPALAGPGRIRGEVRADLAARRDAYRSGRRAGRVDGQLHWFRLGIIF